MEDPNTQKQSDQPEAVKGSANGQPEQAQKQDTGETSEQVVEDAAEQEAERAREADRQRQQRAAQEWASEGGGPRRRTRTTAEGAPSDGKAMNALRATGRAAGSAILLVVKMIRELLQGLFGKITNKDLKGERENLQQEVDAQQRTLNELSGREKDLSHDLKRDQADLKEAREQGRTEGVKKSLRELASEIKGGKEGESAPTPENQEQNSESSPNKIPGGGLAMSMQPRLPSHEDEWVSWVRQYDDGHTAEMPHDDQYLSKLLGDEGRFAVSREAIDEARRMTESFISAADNNTLDTVDGRFPQMLAAVAYTEAVNEAVQAAVDKEDINVPSRKDMQAQVEETIPRIVSYMRERGDHPDKWADSLISRSRYNLKRMDDMRPALNQMGVRLREGGLALDQDKPRNAGLPGPKPGGGLPKLG